MGGWVYGYPKKCSKTLQTYLYVSTKGISNQNGPPRARNPVQTLQNAPNRPLRARTVQLPAPLRQTVLAFVISGFRRRGSSRGSARCSIGTSFEVRSFTCPGTRTNLCTGPRANLLCSHFSSYTLHYRRHVLDTLYSIYASCIHCHYLKRPTNPRGRRAALARAWCTRPGSRV